MGPKHQDRELDIVLLGATGYTGTLAAEHIAEHLPTDLKWALAGRSLGKLERLAAKLKQLHPDRVQPVIEVVSLDDRSQLNSLLKKTRVCISVVLYNAVGTPVIEACIENETDYVDTAGTVTTLGGWVSKFHEKAQSAGVALIHACGAVSAPRDLVVWLAAHALREQSLNTGEVVVRAREQLEPSGGTVESIMTKSQASPAVQKAARGTYFLSPVTGRFPAARPATNLFGLRHVPQLGTLADCTYSAAQDRVITNRTWGLLAELDSKESSSSNGSAAAWLSYGPNYLFNEYDAVPSALAGLGKMAYAAVLATLLSLAPLRAVLRPFLPGPGEGPDPEKVRRGPGSEIVALAYPDDGGGGGNSSSNNNNNAGRARAAVAAFRYPSGPYDVTGAALALGAASLLYHRELLGGVTGGCLTPAFLGMDLVERFRKAGADIDVNVETVGSA